MKRLLLIVLPLLLIVGCSSDPIDGSTLIGKDGLKYAPASDKPYSGVAVEYYENGQKMEEGTYKDGELDGLWTRWYENGQKQWKGTFKDGKEDGKYTRWYENGQKEREGTYKDGGHDGKYTEWNEDGQKKEWESRKEQLLDSINQLKNEQEKLKEQHHKLLTDTTYIEDLARDLFRMALPKEKVFKTLPKSED